VSHGARSKTALVLAGGGSFGAIQAGMLHSLATHGVTADMVVGSSVGSLNGAYYAGNPTLEGIERLEAIWRGLRRSDVFPIGWGAVLGFLVRRNFSSSRTACGRWSRAISSIAIWKTQRFLFTSLRPIS
jgi:NTE family protein